MIDPEKRKLGIGGSDVAAIFDADEFKDAFSVWASKKGGLVRGQPDIRMVVGKYLEEGVIKLYQYITKRQTEFCDVTSVHPERPWMVYTPDALCPGERRGVDAKVVAWDQRRQWDDGVPLRVELQCWWYMAALDYDRWDVCALMGEGMPRIYTIERDREGEAAMLEKVEQWYRRFIVGDDRPPIGGNEDAARWLKQMYPRNRRDLRLATTEEIDALTAYVQIRVQQKELSRRQKALENYFKAAIGDAEGLTWEEGKLTWRKTKDGTWTDWQSMALALLHQHVDDASERERIEAFYTLPKAGVRRMLCTHDDLRAKQDEEEVAA